MLDLGFKSIGIFKGVETLNPETDKEDRGTRYLFNLIKVKPKKDFSSKSQ